MKSEMDNVRRFHPGKVGLYDFANEHDACGVGFVVNINGKKSHTIIEQGIEVLVRLSHRGALGGDNKTGDGAGLLFQIPDEFFRKVSESSGFTLPPSGEYAVGMIFMPVENKLAEKCVKVIEEKIKDENLSLIAWRDVPAKPDCLGEMAAKSCPLIKQVFIGKGGQSLEGDAFERKLYVLRRLIEKELEKRPEIGEAFYVVSMSARTIVYKGLLLAPQIPMFYPDLKDKSMKSALAVVHQRYSTNTFPTWRLAHPFRYLAHNGEINTLQGNINAMRARERSFASDCFGSDIKKLLPVIQKGLSDSACLDNAFEFFVANDRSLAHTAMMLIPEAWGEKYRLGLDLKGFFEYHAGLMEPWDGPAAVVFSDGRAVGASLDRNGLRPARYTITKDGFMVLASEAGVLDIPPENVEKKGRLAAGQILYVDLEQKRVLFNREIKMRVARFLPYRRWVDENKIELSGLIDSAVKTEMDKKTLFKHQNLFGYTREELNMIIHPMVAHAKEPTGSMGNDAALAVLSEKPQLLYAYFKQLFAQVTNPPIDPIREELVMSLTVFIGNRLNILQVTPHHAQLVKLKSPILTDGDIERIRKSQVHSFQSVTLPMKFPAGGGEEELEKALQELIKDAEKAVAQDKSVIILSDKNLEEGYVPIPALLAVSTVHHHLVNCGVRTGTGLVVETGEAREVMHFALLLGYGATAINPYLVFETIADMISDRLYPRDIDLVKAIQNYIKSVDKGLLKIMSKMGISTLRSYRGAQIFEAVGLKNELVEKYFAGTVSRINGIGLDVIAKEANSRYLKAFHPKQGALETLSSGGQYHYRHGEEKHLWTPETITKLQQATRKNDYGIYKEYASYINNQEEHLCTLRGLFKFKENPIPLDEVEPVENIMKRFVTGAMSFGSISKEAHETIATAMNRIGAMSNSGEGGEDPARFKPLPNGDSLCSSIKQVASARFGVTIEYLVNSKELQIKIAQGAKPGEGGQLPGHKVDPSIAKVRNATAGVTLISPPPHHDIYSIEDLAQLIYDLKNANPEARISVKLVSEVGVGTVAAGVAKGHADMVLVSGHDGGTGASPLTSIKHAGLPWELGLAETQQTLVLNHLRDRIKVQTDGQMKTGRDIVIGGLLGAEEFGFGTAALVVCGCVMMRKCHSNTCPVGVATQDPELRKLFSGKPEYLVNFFRMIAQEIREYLAKLGFRKFDDIIGRSDLLEVNKAIEFWKTRNLDFSKVFMRPSDASLPVKCTSKQDHGIENFFDVRLMDKVKNAIENKKPVSLELPICNVDRTAGTMLSGIIAKKYGNAGLPEDTINVTFKGCAGQSFGAFLAHGVTFTLVGEANDYLGKGISGGKIIVKPPENASYNASENIIVGNVLLYGATSGEVYINGRAGERFAIRNSGATVVVEGLGDHGCEYMTGGRVVVLGPTGVNFGAGMSGGIAYIYDEDQFFNDRCNLDMIDLDPVILDEDVKELRSILEKHVLYTGSSKAKYILDNWCDEIPKFAKVFPIEYRKALGRMMKEDAVIKREVQND